MNVSHETRLVLGLLNVTSKVSRKLAGALSMHGLGLSEFLVLSQLAEAPNQTLRRIDLAERVGLTASGVTRLLNPMEKVGLVDKTAGSRDARVSLVTLTRAGQTTLTDAAVAVDHCAQSLLGALDGRQHEELAVLIQALT